MTADVGAYGNGSLVIGAMLCDRYRIDDFLGVGGMGVVVAATDTHAPPGSPFARVALKLLRDELVSKAPIVERFLREARAVLRLSTEHVCKVLDIGRLASGAPVIVMERLDGVDLARTTLKQSLPSTIAVEYVMQACVALAEAHAKGVVHRDLKPANLFVIRRPDGGPMIKVLDFGIAKALFENDAALTRTRMVMGSPGYMSPEQIESAKDVDLRTDIWALGATLYQLLSKRLPFPGRNATEIAIRVAADAPDPLDAEPRIVATIMRCLAKRPEERFADVVALAHELAPFGGPSGRHIAAMVAEAARRGPSGSVSAQLGTPTGPLATQVGTPSAQFGAPSGSRAAVQFDRTMPSGFVPAQSGAPPSGFVPVQAGAPMSGFVPVQSGAPPLGFVPAEAQTASSGHVPTPLGAARDSAGPPTTHTTSPHASPSTAAPRRRRLLYIGIAVAVVVNATVIAVVLNRTSNRGDSHGSNLATVEPSPLGPGSTSPGTPGSTTPGSTTSGSNTPGSNAGTHRGSNREPGSAGSAVDPWGPNAHRSSDGDDDTANDDDSHDDLDSVSGALDTPSGDDSDDHGAAEKAPARPRGSAASSARAGDVPPIDMSKLPNVPGISKQQLQQSFQQAAVACKQLLDGHMPVAVPIEAQASCACVIRDAARAQALLDKAPDNKKPTLKRMCAQFGISLK